jgi:perosamine synthetase
VNDLPIIIEEASVAIAMKAIDEYGLGICFIVDNDQRLVAVATDGDIRRYLLSEEGDKSASVMNCANPNFTSAPDTATPAELNSLTKNFRCVPIIDDGGRLVRAYSDSLISVVPIYRPLLGELEMEYVMRCVQSGWISSRSPFVEDFESLFSDYIGSETAIATSSGTSALELALKGIGLGPGDEVLVPNITFAATANAVLNVGATPVLVDVDATTGMLDFQGVDHYVSKSASAMIFVHLYGNTIDMGELTNWCNTHDLLLIEDCAEALGTFWGGRHVGLFGDASAFSFFGNKTITTGEGGMAIFCRKDDHVKAKSIYSHGFSALDRSNHDYVGSNYRMTGLQASLGLAQLERLDYILAEKQRIVEVYKDLLQGSGFHFPSEPEGGVNSHWLLSLGMPDATSVSVGSLVKELQKNGIEARREFRPLSSMKPFIEYSTGEYGNSNHRYERWLNVPCFPGLLDSEIRQVVDALVRFVKSSR